MGEFLFGHFSLTFWVQVGEEQVQCCSGSWLVQTGRLGGQSGPQGHSDPRQGQGHQAESRSLGGGRGGGRGIAYCIK
jgi:hypothetical protein